MRTGSLMEVAAVLKGLVALSRTKPLSFREKKMLERAKYLLVSELATVRNTTEQTVETNIVRALAKAKLQMPEAGALLGLTLPTGFSSMLIRAQPSWVVPGFFLGRSALDFPPVLFPRNELRRRS